MPISVGQKLRASRLSEVANTDIFNSIGGCTLSTTSASYVDITNATKSFTKIGSATDSDLIVTASLSGFSTVTGTDFRVGVNVDSTDYDLVKMAFNTANTHTALPTGAVRITGLAAGTYTVKLRAKRPAGTGTLTVDSGDSVSMVIHERPI